MKKMTKKITEEQKEAWFEAARNNDIETVKRMTKEGIDVNYKNYNGWTALYYACFCRHADMIKLLLDNGADINIRNDNIGWTPLHLACAYGQIDIAKFLIENNADIILKDNIGCTPLDNLKPYKEKHEELIEWLTEEYPEKALEAMASENIQGKGVGL